MDTKQFAEICQRRHAAGESFQTIANDYPPATKPAIRRVCLSEHVTQRLAQAIGLDPTKKQLRDRERRKEQRAELERYRYALAYIVHQFGECPANNPHCPAQEMQDIAREALHPNGE